MDFVQRENIIYRKVDVMCDERGLRDVLLELDLLEEFEEWERKELVMKLAVVGGRDFSDVDLFNKSIKEYNGIDCIVSGGARGADSMGEQYANRNGITTKIFYPEWDRYGRSAGYKRNVLIVEYADEVIAFWDGVSRGTKHSIDIAKSMNKKVNIVNY
jgi:hypothetical protein